MSTYGHAMASGGRQQQAPPARSDHASAPLRNDSTPWSIDHPVAGLAVMIGLLFAIFLLPMDLDSRTALRVPAAVFIFSLCLLPGLAALRDPKSIFRAEHVLMIAPVYWLLLDPLQGRSEMSGIGIEQIQRSFVAIAVFVFAAWVAFLQRPWRAPQFVWRAIRVEHSSEFYFGIGVLAFVLGFLKYAIPSGFDLAAMAQAVAGGRWEGAWGRGELGGADAFLDHLSYFGYLLPPITVILARRVGWADRRSFVLMICTLIMSAFLIQGGGRRLVGMFFGTGAVVWFLAKAKVRLSTILGLAFVMFGLLFVFEQMLSYRNVGVLAIFQSESTPEVDDSGTLVRVDDNFLRLAQTTAIFPDLHSYTTWRYALWVAVRPVPRLFWPGKPIDPGFNLPEFVGVKGASLSSSVIGELFMAGGFIAVGLGGWFYGRLARSLSHFLAQARTTGAALLYSIGLFALFTGMRSMLELVLTSYIVLAWVVLVRIHGGFRGSSHV